MAIEIVDLLNFISSDFPVRYGKLPEGTKCTPWFLDMFHDIYHYDDSKELSE